MNKTTQLLGKTMAVALLGISLAQAQTYTGKFSSEGDITAKGIMTMELTQTKAKVDGVATYKSFDNSVDAGLLSVNGYVKDGTAYVRLRDQRGGTVADGDIHFQGNSMIHFTQSTASSSVPKSAYLYSEKAAKPAAAAPVNNSYFTGNYSNEGDTTSKGILSFEMKQTGTKLEGTAKYTAFDNSVDTGIISVNGYTKDGVGYVRFRDSNGNTLADGTLKKSGTNTVFDQTTNSTWLPKKAFLYR